MKFWYLLPVSLLTIACGSSPNGPTPVTPPVTPTPTLATITGHVTATNGGQPLGGLSASLAGHPATTDGAGTFSVQTTPAGSALLLLSGSGIVPRSLSLAALSSHDVAVGAIALGSGFDLTFYREFVRNGFEGGNEPLRRWTQTPQIYLKTVDEAGEVINVATLDQIAALAQDSVPRWTNGQLGTPAITRGTESREGVSGWITIKFPAVNTLATEGVCGRSQVGQNGGWVELAYHVPAGGALNCRVPGYVIAPRTVRHEIGHAMGFWHTDNPGDLMWGGSFTDANQFPSPRERVHAAIAYQRPVGNLDPDQDPTSVVTLASKVVR